MCSFPPIDFVLVRTTNHRSAGLTSRRCVYFYLYALLTDSFLTSTLLFRHVSGNVFIVSFFSFDLPYPEYFFPWWCNHKDLLFFSFLSFGYCEVCHFLFIYVLAENQTLEYVMVTV